MMETVLEATARLRDAGYDIDFRATDHGMLRCDACGTDHDATSLAVDEVVRNEGESDPADETILLALRCECGRRGVFFAGFGPIASPAAVTVLQRLR